MTATALAHCARHLVALKHHVHSAHLCTGASALRQRHACAQRTMNPKYGCPPLPPQVSHVGMAPTLFDTDCRTAKRRSVDPLWASSIRARFFASACNARTSLLSN